jgi:hypothetical protein
MRDKRYFLIPVLVLSCALTVWGRDVEIAVEDTDLQIPLEGARIRSWDGAEYECDDDGRAVISVPDERQVTIQVTYPGYETGRLVIPLTGGSFTLGLRLGGLLESRELVIEAQRPGSSETRSGRSVAISGETLTRSAEIGIIEDVMTAIKLLPGVGYTGMFNALPSVRGGEPGDLMAVFDGFYVTNPYHWGGGFSIFDPHMVESAQLSHGIFSTRYGHTVSGLLDITSKKASSAVAELELGISSSAVNLNLSIPLGGRGGLLLMGKVTYWDPFIYGAQAVAPYIGLDDDTVSALRAVTTAPYIRSTAVNFDYRFNQDLELTALAFLGADGVGADYKNEYETASYGASMDMVFDWENVQGFLIGGLTWNPGPDKVLKGMLGAGFESALINGRIDYDYLWVEFTDRFFDNPYIQGLEAGNPNYFKHLGDPSRKGYLFTGTTADEILNSYIDANETIASLQGRLDFDWSLGSGLLFASGAEERYSRTSMYQTAKTVYESATLPIVHYPKVYETEPTNHAFTTSAYSLLEFGTPGQTFGAELGLRMDHLYFISSGMDRIMTTPVFNPRLNLDFNVFRNRGVVESMDLTAGSGLFSSIDDALSVIDSLGGTDAGDVRPNRSWTTVGGLKMDFAGGWSFNIEGYFKYVFDRAYQYMAASPGKDSMAYTQRFNGDGRVWGFDLMLQKFDSRYWDGWVSYTFTHARYHEPESVGGLAADNSLIIEDSQWYYPYFHRFHNLNLVLNIKPTRNINIYTRFGAASGRPKAKVGAISSYPVTVLDEEGNPKHYDNDPASLIIIEKYKRVSSYSDSERTTWSFPLDIKLSYLMFSPASKVQTELYIAAENVLSLVYNAQANTSFNTYTGVEDTGSDAASYEMPIPMISIGMKWSF